jgi:hypothetical protein
MCGFPFFKQIKEALGAERGTFGDCEIERFLLNPNRFAEIPRLSVGRGKCFEILSMSPIPLKLARLLGEAQRMGRFVDRPGSISVLCNRGGRPETGSTRPEVRDIGSEFDCFVEKWQSVFVLAAAKPPQAEVEKGVSVPWIAPDLLEKTAT